MDTALFLTLFLFAVQIAAGVAPMRWPQCAWLAGLIFWLSLAGAVGSLAWYIVSHSDWFISNLETMGRQKIAIALGIVSAIGLVSAFSLYGSGNKPAPASPGASTVASGAHSNATVLSKLTNTQLRNHAIAFAARMRTFEANLRVDEDIARVQEMGRQIPRPKSEEESAEIFRRRVAESIRTQTAKDLAYINNLRPEAIAIRDELELRLERIGILKPTGYESVRATRALEGSLAGIKPITEAADFLEQRARRLPD